MNKFEILEILSVLLFYFYFLNILFIILFPRIWYHNRRLELLIGVLTSWAILKFTNINKQNTKIKIYC